MVQGGYLRTNWRQSENALNTNALVGDNYPSAVRPAPLVFFSTSGTNAAGGLVIGAYSVMSAYFGSTIAQQMGSGFKILPIGINTRLLVVSNSAGNLWFSVSTSDDSNIEFYCRDGSISDVSFSYAFAFTGFIVSTP